MTMDGQPEGSCGLCCCQRTNDPVDMPCCCDCEALDNICDRCCRCQAVSSDDVDRLLTNMEARCRFPSCSGHGAVQVRLDLVMPLVVVPLSLLISANSQYLMYAVFSLLVLVLMAYYRVWKRNMKQTRLRFFYSWSVTSCLTLYYVFQLVITVYREVLFWENLLFSSMFAATMYCLYLTRCNPGYARTNKAKKGRHRRVGSTEAGSNGGKAPTAVTSLQNNHCALYDLNQLGSGRAVANSNGIGAGVKTSGHTNLWIEPGVSVVWCDQCHLDVPVGSAHCPVCGVCVLERDHHCIWIDNCIGVNNHRPFFIGLVLLICTGLYGTQLMLTTVCTPEMYYDWFLVPTDCTLVYSNFISGLGYVSVVYALCGIAGCSLMFVYQVILISQNVTSQQLVSARRAGRVQFRLFVINNPNSHGICTNWKMFFLAKRRKFSQLIVT